MAKTHETVSSWVDPPPEMAGSAWRSQREPFQRSASGRKVPLISYEPTASQESAAVQEMPFSAAKDPPAGTWTGRVTHDEPFQTSENRPVPSLPTARQAPAVGQATADSRPPPPAGMGTGWMLHAEPFQRSASSLGVPVPIADEPTAVHAAVPEHATAARSLVVAPTGTGGLTCVQELPFQRSATGA